MAKHKNRPWWQRESGRGTRPAKAMLATLELARETLQVMPPSFEDLSRPVLLSLSQGLLYLVTFCLAVRHLSCVLWCHFICPSTVLYLPHAIQFEAGEMRRSHTGAS